MSLAMVGLLNLYTVLGERLEGLRAEFKFVLLKLTIFLIIVQELILHMLVEDGESFRSSFSFLAGPFLFLLLPPPISSLC